MSKEGFNLIVKRLNAQFMERGYITTRLGVPEQDMTKGEFRLKLIRGVIRNIRFSDPAVYGTWRNAFPLHPGDLLNVRDLEQGLEQMKGVPSQEVDIKLDPGDIPGQSDVIISVKRGKFWRTSQSLNDSGSLSTGKRQYSVNLSLDNPLGVNDILTVGASHDAEYSPLYSTEGYNYYYAFPYEYWTFAFSANTYRYHQTVYGITQNFDYSGASYSLGLDIQRVIHRGRFGKTSLQFKVNQYHGESFIENVEIEVQRRDATNAEIALLHRHYLGKAQIDLSLGYRQGMRWLSATRDPEGTGPDRPTHFYKMAIGEANISLPFQFAIPLRYSGTFRGQYTQDNLFYADTFAVGNRWTVRGFDGERSLAAESGYLIRNELEAPIAQTGQAIYAGLDYGYVDGQSNVYLPGKRLIGAALGMRGAWKGFSYDFSGGWPLDKPEGFRSDNSVFAFQVNCQF